MWTVWPCGLEAAQENSPSEGDRLWARLGLHSAPAWIYTRDGWLPSAYVTNGSFWQQKKTYLLMYPVNLLNSFDRLLVCWLGGSEVWCAILRRGLSGLLGLPACPWGRGNPPFVCTANRLCNHLKTWHENFGYQSRNINSVQNTRSMSIFDHQHIFQLVQYLI